MINVVIYCGKWHTNTTIPRPVAGDIIRHRGESLPVKSVTLRSGSPIVEVLVDKSYASDDYHMERDGWEQPE